MLTKEDLEQIATTFGLTIPEEKFKVKDGFVTQNESIWWHSSHGPEQVTVATRDHRQNVLSYPDCYSIRKPYYKVEYLD
ncbi:hypothetical protein D3C87_323730 [compost metagenome]